MHIIKWWSIWTLGLYSYLRILLSTLGCRMGGLKRLIPLFSRGVYHLQGFTHNNGIKGHDQALNSVWDLIHWASHLVKFTCTAEEWPLQEEGLSSYPKIVGDSRFRLNLIEW